MAVPLRFLQLSRRTLLRGAGAGLALPWLDAMWPACRPSRPAPLRTAFVFAPNGVIGSAWRPSATGSAFELPPTLAPLEPVRSSLLVLSGLGQDAGRAHGDGPGDHARAAASYLTAAHPRKTAGTDVRAGTSIDQVIARQIGDRTKLPSLEVGMEGGRHTGSCDSGYSCAYSRAIAWRTPTTPLAVASRPREVFTRLFGDPDELADDAAREARAHTRQSVLDAVLPDARRLRRQLGSGDRGRVDEYLDAVRQVERRLARHEPPPGIPMHLLSELDDRGYRDRLRLQYELCALAFQTDSTRVLSFMVGNAGSNRSYRWLDVSEGHHTLSHHRGDPVKIDKLARIDRFHVEELTRFLARLDATEDGDGSLLEHAMVLYGSSLGDGNRHTHRDLPVLLAGGGNGTLRGNRHLRYPRDTPLADLFVSMLRRLGLPAKSFGDSRGPLDDLGQSV